MRCKQISRGYRSFVEPEADSPGLPDIPEYVRVLWHGESADRPGPRRGLDLHAIAAAGVRIADAEGLAALSMRRLAGEVGLTTMGLYRYVNSKAEILALVLDHASVPVPSYPAELVGWRPRLRLWGALFFGSLMARPWVLQVPIQEPPITPNQVRWMEAGLTALAETNLSEQEKLSSMLVVDIFVRGQVQLTLGMSQVPPAHTYSARLLSLLEPAEFPHLVAALHSGALDDGEPDEFGSDMFEFGLDNVLDGIASRVARRG